MQFSIVMTVYQNERFFPRALHSVMQQTWTDWQLIIMADGPHPKIRYTLDVFEKRRATKQPIIYQECARVPGTFGNQLRRHGLELAPPGNAICFMGHDCLLDKDYLATHVAALRRQGVGCLSVVRVNYWTPHPCGRPAKPRYDPDWGDTELFAIALPCKHVPAEWRAGDIDLMCYAMQVARARMAGIFRPEWDKEYEADFLSFAAARNLLEVCYTPAVVGAHF